MEKFEPTDQTWDFKKILLFMVVLGVIGFGLKTYILDKNINQKGVKGANISQNSASVLNFSPKQEIKKDVENKLNELKREINNINVVDIATSSPAVQKVLNDFKNLQNLPQSQAKKACINICNGL